MDPARSAADAVRAQIARGAWHDALFAALDLTQVPHPLDTRPGSTLSFGLDVLEAWAAAAHDAHARVDDPAAWDAVRTRLLTALAASHTHTSTVHRLRRVFLAFFHTAQRTHTEPLAWARSVYAAVDAAPDAPDTLVVHEALVTAYGTAILPQGTSVAAFFAALLDAMQAGRGSVSRRSRLAIAIVRACRDERVPPDAWRVPLAHALLDADDRGRENVVAHLVQPLLDAWPAAMHDVLAALHAASARAADPAEAAEARVGALLAVLRAAKVRELCVVGTPDNDARQDLGRDARGSGGGVDAAGDTPDASASAPLATDAPASDRPAFSSPASSPPASAPLVVPSTFLRPCVEAASPRLAVAALALAVESKTPAAPLHAAELEVVHTFFATRLTLPSAVARKDCIALFVKLLVRLRVGMHALAKQKHAGHRTTALTAMHTLVPTLYTHLVEATHPGAPYACTILSVSLLFLLLEAALPLPPPPRDAPHETFALSDAVRALHKAKHTYPADAAFAGVVPNAALTTRLLHLATTNTYDDVQHTATRLLLRLTHVREAALDAPPFVRAQMVQPSVAQLGALKDSEAYAAVQLLRLYHACAAQDAAYVCAYIGAAAREMDPRGPNGAAAEAADGRVGDAQAADGTSEPSAALPAAWTAQLLDAHLALLDARLAYAETHGIGAASHAQALHGTLAAVHLLVTHLAADEAATYVPRIEHAIRRAWHITAPVLCAAAPEGGAQGDDGDDGDDGDASDDDDAEPTGAEPTGGAAPPGGAVATGTPPPGDAKPTGTASLGAPTEPAPELHQAMRLAGSLDTPAYQRILSYAWRAVKEAAGLHATVVGVRATGSGAADRGALDAANDLFLDWMLRIRHRGAFSTVYPAYTRAAKALLAHGIDAPTAWLAQLLARLDAECEQVSTTRRSAGIGYAVLALLAALPSKRAAPHVAETVAQLERMSHSPHPVRTIHALNVVRVLVMDSTLAPAMRAHLGTALARAVACFVSAHWGVRNASMMLFSAVCTRYYGIHALSPSAGGGGGRRTLDALLATCPALGEALVATLARGAEHGQGGTEHGSALYASLLLLSTLGADQVAATSPAALLLASLRTHVEPWAYGANAQLRAAAATCYAALLPPAERAEVAERVARGASLRDQNRLHGQLLLLRALGVPAAVPADVLDGNACAVTVAAYLDVVRDDLARATLATDVRAHTAAWLARLLDAACTSTEDGGPMGRLLRDPFRTWVLAPAWSLALALRVRLPSVQVALRAHDDVRAPLLAHLGTAHAAVADAGWDPAQVFAAACNVARAREPAHDVRIAAAHLAYALRAHAQWTDAERTALLVAAWTAESAGVREALIPLLGAAAHGDGEHRLELARACVPLWEACTADDASLAARLGTAHALKAAGVGDVEADAPAEGRRLGAAHGAAPAPLALRTHRILLHLVHDDHADVRDAACALVSPSVARPTSFGALAAFAPALRALRMGDVACTEHLWRTLSDAAPTAFASDAASLLAAPTHAAQQHAAHTLFPTEAANQYYDRVADMLRAHRFFASRRLPVPAALREAGAAPLAGADAPFAVRLQRALCADLGAVLRGEKRPEVVDAAFGALLVTPWRPKAQAKGGAGTPGLDGGSDGGPRGGPDGGSAGGPGAPTPPGNTPASEYAAPPASDTAAYSAPPASDPSARSAPAPSDPASAPSGPHPLCIAYADPTHP